MLARRSLTLGKPMDTENIDYTAELPMRSPWERAAAKELANLNYLLMNGVYESRSDFTRAVRELGAALDVMYADTPGTIDVTTIFEVTPWNTPNY